MTATNHESEPGASSDAAPADAGAAASPPPGDSAVTVLPPASAAVHAADHLPTEALHQLRKLGEMREQELKRHELVIAEMREHVRRQSRSGRLLVLLGGGMLALIAGLALAIHQLRSEQGRATEALAATTLEVGRVGGLVRDAATQSATQLDGVGAGLAANVRKLDSVQLGLHATVNDSVQSLRQEREAIVGGVRLALEDQNRKLVEREIELRNRETELQKEVLRVRAERQRIIQEAIEKLSTLSKDPATPPAP